MLISSLQNLNFERKDNTKQNKSVHKNHYKSLISTNLGRYFKICITL